MNFPEHKPGIGGIKWWHRINLPGTGYTEGIVNHGPDGGDWPTTRFGMPADLTGKHVLDVGCWDGFFSFEAAARGARVFATDTYTSRGGNPLGTEGFEYAREALGYGYSKIDFDRLDIQDYHQCEALHHANGTFDVVLCYGVLYHLKSPLLAMENLAKLTASGGICLIETAIYNSRGVPALVYQPGHEGDPTNYFYPNIEWMHVAAQQVGFKSCEAIYNKDSRATFRLEKA